jgi:hypothetical protein
MTGNKSVQTSPVIQYNIYLIPEIGMMRRPETAEKGFEKFGRYLVTQGNQQRDRQKNQQDFFPILFVYEDNNETQVKRNPCPFIRIQPKKIIPKNRFASIEKIEQIPFQL